jgi:hypothetical protein
LAVALQNTGTIAAASHYLEGETAWARKRMEVAMAEIRETYMSKERGFGGRLGSRKTLWTVFVVSASMIAVGAFYLLPQFW